jgi:hypothetical protein
VHVGQHRQAEALADFGEDRQGRIEADAAGRAGGGAVGLVEGGLEDEAEAETGADLLQRRRHLQGVGAALQLARPCDDRQRQVVAEGDVADLDGCVGAHVSRPVR